MGCMRWCRWRSSVKPRIDFEALAAFVDWAGMCALTGLYSRRLARFGGSVCGATDLKFRWPHACILPTTPRTPPRWKPARRGQTEQEKGCAIVKIFKGVSGILEKPVDGTAYYHVSRCFSKQKCPTGCLWIPRVVPFLPRVVPFLPRAVFCVFSDLRSASISISLIYIKKERKREAFRCGEPIHGFFWCTNTHSTGMVFNPRVFRGLFFEQNPILARVCGRFAPDPRIHGLKCLYPPGKGSQ